jgi:hypothetical protein
VQRLILVTELMLKRRVSPALIAVVQPVSVADSAFNAEEIVGLADAVMLSALVGG